MKRSICLLMLLLVGAAGVAVAQNKVLVRPLGDAAARAQSSDWFNREAQIPIQLPRIERSIMSPDKKKFLKFQSVPGLNVQTWRVVLSVSGPDREVCKQALDAWFSPTSDWVFVATGPHPLLYQVASYKTIPLDDIDSGLENKPVWLSSWSKDGTTLVVYQQATNDQMTNPRAWSITIPR